MLTGLSDRGRPRRAALNVQVRVDAEADHLEPRGSHVPFGRRSRRETRASDEGHVAEERRTMLR